MESGSLVRMPIDVDTDSGTGAGHDDGMVAPSHAIRVCVQGGTMRTSCPARAGQGLHRACGGSATHVVTIGDREAGAVMGKRPCINVNIYLQ